MIMISGIYKIINKVNGKYYIGSSNDIKRRWEFHRSRLNTNNHYNDYLQNAWNKYKKENFDFVVIEETTKSNLLTTEQKYLDIIKNKQNECYNLNFDTSGGEISEYSKSKIKKSQIGKNNSFYGKKHSLKTKRIISENGIGKSKGFYSNKPFIFYNFITKDIFEGTPFQLRNKYNLCSSAMTNLLHGRTNYVKGWIIMNQDNVNSLSKKFTQPEKSLAIVSNPNLSNAIAPA
jgi:group I intron endonuclease